MDAIRMMGIVKCFGPVRANDGIDLIVKQQEIHCLLGENGTGKSTLMNILFGLYHPDAGEIYINEKKASVTNPNDAGAMAATLTGLTLSFLPAPILLVVSIAAGIAAGMLVGSVPGIFKAKFQTNEVIVAIMLNYVCTLFTSWLVNGPFKVPGSTAQTEMLPENIWFARLLPKTQLTWALFLLLATAVLMYIFLWKTSVGYQLRAVGANASAAKTAGISVNFYLIMAMTLSGGIAALAGVTEIFGKYHRFIEGFSPSFGFTGIAVAILGKNHPAGVLLTSLLFGVLEMGSLRMSRETAVSTNMVTVIQSLVILFVAAPELIRWSRKRRG